MSLQNEQNLQQVDPYDPQFPPQEYSFSRNSIKDVYGLSTKRYIRSCERKFDEINIVELLCPDYPHDGKNFTYQGEMGSGLNPTVSSQFIPQTELLLYGINKLIGRVPDVSIYPLVCEIESDLPMVTEVFAQGSQERFLSCIRSSYTQAQDLYNSRFPYSKVYAQDFTGLLGNLNQRQEHVDYLIQQGLLPDIFNEQVKNVAESRTFMFSKLYGAQTYEQFIFIATRQMRNYLAVYKALSERFPTGCIVLNKHTPNEFYLKQGELLRDLLQIDKGTVLPNFHFF